MCPKPKAADTLKMYALTGIVTAVKANARTITVHNTQIHGLMEAIERDYSLKDDAAFRKVQEGDFVHATLLTDEADVWLLDEATFVRKRARRRA